MKETFLTQFTNKATKAHEKSTGYFKEQDYMGFLAGHFEEGYYQTLAFAVNGQDHGDGQSVIDSFWEYFKVEQQGKSRVTQALKKMGKLERIPEIEAVIKRFFTDVSDDLLALANKSTQIYYALMNMGSSEKIEKGLTRKANNEADPEDKLFLGDKVIMGILNRRKSQKYIGGLIKEVQKILA